QIVCCSERLGAACQCAVGMALPQQDQRDETAREHPGLEAPLENRGHAVGRVVERKRPIKMIKGGCQIAAEEGAHAHHAMSHDDRRSVPVPLCKTKYLLGNLASDIRSGGMRVIQLKA